MMESPLLVQYWRCNKCDFETFNFVEKETHLLLFENDERHLVNESREDEDNDIRTAL